MSPWHILFFRFINRLTDFTDNADLGFSEFVKNYE